MTKIVFALGSNLGDREGYLLAAGELLQERLRLRNVKKSQIFQNKAMLLEGSPPEWDVDFFNIALSGEVDLNEFSAIEILQIIKEIEVLVGRQERARWAPREIDIDILAIDEMQVEVGEKLIIPHVGLFEREFFYKVFLEIEGELFERLKLKFG
jgi:2-amino-4-hydroxy-6-hydroxymethyldihydropteridine diphosphokinase